MKIVMKASEIGSTLTHMPGNRGKAVFKTLDKGQYAIASKNVTMENAKTGEIVNLGNSEPVFAKELVEYNMLMPKDKLIKTLPGMVGKFFESRGTWSDKEEWNVKFTKM